MVKYTIRLSSKAAKQLDKLTDNIAAPIITAMAKLSDEPRPKGCIKLQGRDGFRIRVGNYRIIYEILDKELLIDVISVGNRKDVYE